jgi:hypothetical protein
LVIRLFNLVVQLHPALNALFQGLLRHYCTITDCVIMSTNMFISIFPYFDIKTRRWFTNGVRVLGAINNVF